MNTDLSDKLTFLNSLLRSGKYPKGIEFLGAGGGNFYQCTMRHRIAMLKLYGLETPTKKSRIVFAIMTSQ